MTKEAKIRARIAAGDRNIRFGQLDAYLTKIGATSRQSGSHVDYALPNGQHVGIVKPHGTSKTVARHYITNLDEQLRKAGL